MAAARSYRRLLVITFAAVIGAGVFFALVLVLASGGGNTQARPRGPLYLGQQADLNTSLDLGSPLYFANPFGGRGFWLDREDGEFVALDVGLPGNPQCSIVWKGRYDTYLDCDGRRLESDQMARHPVSVSVTGQTKNGVYVELRTLDPPPSPAD